MRYGHVVVTLSVVLQGALKALLLVVRGNRVIYKEMERSASVNV